MILSSILAWLLVREELNCQTRLGDDKTLKPPTLCKVVIRAKLAKLMQDLLGAGRFRHGFSDPDGSLQGFPRRHGPGRLAVPFIVCSAAPCPAEHPNLVHVSGVHSV